MEEVLVVPPAGPLEWLHPELRSLEESASASPGVRVIDLRASPRFGHGLVTAVAGAARVAIPRGPRGRTLARVLSDLGACAKTDVRFVERPTSLERALARPDGVADGETRFTVHRVDPADLQLDRRLPPGAIPVLSRDDRTEPSSTRLAESFYGVLPGDSYSDATRRAWHEMLQRAWPSRMPTFRWLENLALAGLDPYEDMLRGRGEAQEPLGPWPASRRARIFAIDGIDGAGKSTQLRALRAHLEVRGLRVAQHRIFRHGVFHDTVTDLTRACRRDRSLHLWPLQRRIKVFDSLKVFFTQVTTDLARQDVVLFDRYVSTHLAAGRGRYHYDPCAAEWLSVFPAADRVFLLDLPEDVAMRRIDARSSRTVDENPYMLSRYRAALRALAHEPGYVLLDGALPAEDLSERIRRDVDQILAGGLR